MTKTFAAKTFATLTAIGALSLTPALAQSGPASNPARPPAMQAPAKPATPPQNSASRPSPSSANHTTGMAAASAKPSPVDQQRPDQFLALSFKGTDGKKIGDVSDILFEKDGSIKAYVVGVGGFLGIGAKSVAFDPKSFEVVPGKSPSDTKLKLAMNKDELKAAATFKPYKAPTPASATTGMSPRHANGSTPPR